MCQLSACFGSFIAGSLQGWLLVSGIPGWGQSTGALMGLHHCTAAMQPCGLVLMLANWWAGKPLALMGWEEALQNDVCQHNVMVE